jgi:predicted RNA-binding protein YlqC (UPF0109 family)
VRDAVSWINQDDTRGKHMDAKLLVEKLAKALVDSPDEVVVNEVWGEKASVIQLKVAKGDLGKVIGKRGRNANAMRRLLVAAATKEKRGLVLEILE